MGSMNKIRIGIDPGLTGGIAWHVTKNQFMIDEVIKMPETGKDLSDFFQMICDSYIDESTDVMCWMERVHAFPTSKKIDNSELIRNLNRDMTGLTIPQQNLVRHAQRELQNTYKVTRGAKATWTFAENWGRLQQCLIDFKIPFDTILPRDWQKIVGVHGTRDKSNHKRNLKAKAQQLFPNIKVTLNTADALLLLHVAKCSGETTSKPKSTLF